MEKNRALNTIVLKPLSFVWESAYRVRRSFYEYGILKKDYFKVPIISIGNITFGGTGKTPMIIWLNNKLERFGFESIVLTRGYKGNLEHKSGIIKGGQKFLSNPNEYGDEPLLISKKMNRGAVVVGKRRSQNLKKYFHEVNPDVVLLDDGFQHIQLYRSFNIVLFDALLPLESYKTAPLGYLREGLTALKDADAILISRADQASEEQLDKLQQLLKKYHRPNIPMGRFCYKPIGLHDCFGEKQMDVIDLKGRKVIALTAIASPESFYRLIEEQGGEIMEKMVYADHHFFTHQDLKDILFQCDKHDAIVVTSEKDMVKLKKVTKDSRILSIEIGVHFLTGEEALLNKIKGILKLDYN
jgi:tetraacyldisaccharide 4'-kinase